MDNSTALLIAWLTIIRKFSSRGPTSRNESRHAEQNGFDLGVYTAEVCPSCGEVFWKESDVRKMEQRAKRIGVWGLEQKTEVATVGNSLAVRIPKRLADFLGLKRGVEVVIHPMGKDKLIIEETGKHG